MSRKRSDHRRCSRADLILCLPPSIQSAIFGRASLVVFRIMTLGMRSRTHVVQACVDSCGVAWWSAQCIAQDDQKKTGLSEEALAEHMPLYHGTEPNMRGKCPVCGDPCRRVPLVVHLHNEHGRLDAREPPPAPYPAFAWSVCRRPSDGKFLLVNEPAGISGGKPGYWLPAGRVDQGESLEEAARRECMEEAGIVVKVDGVLRFMVDNMRVPKVMRVALLTSPVEGTGLEPKSVPDFESVGALWAAAEDLERLRDEDYRSPDPAELYPQVASGRLPAHPIDTDAFRSLEAVLRRLTRGEQGAEAELGHVWRALREAYPASAFQSSR